MISGGQIPWNATTVCRMLKISWQTGNLNMNEDLVNHSQDQLFHSVHSWNTSQTPRETKARIHPFGKKVLPGFFERICFDRGENSERKHSDCWYWRIGKVACIRSIYQKTECKRSPDNPQRRSFLKGYALIAGRIRKGNILIADIEELEKLHASEVSTRRLNAKEVLITHKDWEFVFPVADGSAKLSERETTNSKNPLWDGNPHREERESQRRISWR